MKPKFIVIATVLLFATQACLLSSPSLPDQASLATSVAATVQALTANTAAPGPETAIPPTNIPPAATPIPATPIPATPVPATAPTGNPVSFQNISLIIPSGLANNAAGQIVPEMNAANSAPWSIAPEHTLLTLTGYPITRTGFEPEIHVYPADQYAGANPAGANSLSRLRTILSNPGLPLTNDNVPGVPYFNAAQLYAAQASLLQFQNGQGLRMISESAQYFAPITSDLSYYHFEGLTLDGKYFIVAIFPIIVPLQATLENPSADGIPFPTDPGDATSSKNYFLAITDRLNSASPESFQPPLTQLDALIQSIQIKP